MPRNQRLREELIDVGRLLYERGFLFSTTGNLSVKLDDNTILTTPSGTAKGFLRPDHLVTVDREGRPTASLSGSNTVPSSELKLHLEVYRQRPDVEAVVHAHPPITTALSIAKISLECPILPEIIISLGRIPTAPYATPSTEEVPASIRDLIGEHNAIVLERHGAVTVGRNLFEAFYRLEAVEHTAQVLFLLHQLGSMHPVSDEELLNLLDVQQRLWSRRPMAGNRS